ncbi:hypothetical protein DFQ27_006095 [Actinomortierella ambigua]|uniref:Mediator of RNA polymerase II transcription subunit 18 n=1 Tax=Actinomortierella ambigua TaxID=1343610 RepID=A0A9P6PZE6_9FUNG|nr:hypothetical protein DFQ27_006095 [Actinomortierella ambigua]
MSMRTPTSSAASMPGSAAAGGAMAGVNVSMVGGGIGAPGMTLAGMNASSAGGVSQAQPTTSIAGGGPTPVQQPPALLLGATFECSLSGSVIVGQFRHLYDRLSGLCEHGSSQTMFEHEMLYIPAAVQRPVYPSARNDEIQLRLRVKMTPQTKSRSGRHHLASEASAALGATGRSKKKQRRAMDLDASDAAASGATVALDGGDESMDGISSGDHHEARPRKEVLPHHPVSSHHDHHLLQPQQVFTRQYQICQFGHQEPGRNLVVRSAIVVKIQGDPFTFLTLLGYTFDDEYVRIGYNFVYNNACRIAVFRQYKLERPHDPLSIIRPGAPSAGTNGGGGGAAAIGEAGGVGTNGGAQQQQSSQQPSTTTAVTAAGATASGSSTPISSANVTPLTTPLLGGSDHAVPTPTSTPTPIPPTPASSAATLSHSTTTPTTTTTTSTTLGEAGSSSTNPTVNAGAAATATTAAATMAVVEPPWMIEISSAFVTQENVNAMTEEINHVRALLAGSVRFNS